MIGAWSDRCRSRFGRRRPFIAVGCVAGALLFPLIWWVPPTATPAFAAGWFLVTGLLFYTSFAVFSMPYIGLSLELSSDYDERTRIAAIRILFGVLTALLISRSFHLAQWDWFGSPFVGMRTLGIVMGVLYLAGGLPSAFFLRERYQESAKRQPRLSLLASARGTLGNRSFRVLLGLTILMVLGVNTFEAFTFYVNTYHVFGGDVKQAALYQGLGSSIAAGAALFAVPAVTWLSGHIGKAPAAIVCLGCGIVASASKWVLHAPEHPHWQLAVPVLIAPCAGGFWALVHSMKADICDEEELRTGQRREGMIESVSAWTHKTTVAVTFGLSGAFLVFTGFEQELGRQ